MRTVVLGGSFDPPHIGHLFLVQEVMYQFDYDRAVLVPAAEAPHKAPSGESSPEQRLEMVSAAIDGIDGVTVDDCEIARGGRSYTIDTIPVLEERYRPSGKLGLILGDDLIAGFTSWRAYEELVSRVDIVIAHRGSAERVSFPYPHRYADNLLLPISSSAIRDRVGAGQPYRHIVPEAVFRYIERCMLYRQKDEN